MSFLTYLVPFSLTVVIWVYGFIPVNLVFHFIAYAVLVNLGFLLLFHTGINLKFKEPSLTGPQMVASIIPGLYVMYFLDAGQGRAIVMLIIAVPLMYGILALSTRQFINVGFWFLFLYLAMMTALWLNKPEVMDLGLEFIQIMAFILAIVSSSIIGGFIYSLRIKLRERNRELKEAVAKIEELANLDSLTGIFNRRRIFEMLSQEVNRFSRAQGPFSVCMLDIDHFKDVNDLYGHQAGDDILRDIACKVSGNLRSIDGFGRYGGEEFLVVLPQTTLEGAIIKAQRICLQVKSLRFPAISEDLVVTVSIGVAEYYKSEDIDETLARADRCLYEAKHQGRNCVIAEARDAGNGLKDGAPSES